MSLCSFPSLAESTSLVRMTDKCYNFLYSQVLHGFSWPLEKHILFSWPFFLRATAIAEHTLWSRTSCSQQGTICTESKEWRGGGHVQQHRGPHRLVQGTASPRGLVASVQEKHYQTWQATCTLRCCIQGSTSDGTTLFMAREAAQTSTLSQDSWILIPAVKFSVWPSASCRAIFKTCTCSYI